MDCPVEWQESYAENKESWNKFKNKVSQNENEEKQLDDQLTEYFHQTKNIATQLVKFEGFLRQMYIPAILGHWERSLRVNESYGDRYLDKISKLHEIIPLRDHLGNLQTLEYFMNGGHQEILEKIRCKKEWSLFEKEEIVKCYIQFSRDLARDAKGLVPPGFDPDRGRADNKIVRYEAFLDFVQHLPERDALIAKLLYFGAPSLEEILFLKKNAIHLMNFSVNFSSFPICFPQHVIYDLNEYIKNKNSQQDLVFTNVRGAEVERTHLNQCFARACDKTASKEKITPGILLKLKNDAVKYKN